MFTSIVPPTPPHLLPSLDQIAANARAQVIATVPMSSLPSPKFQTRRRAGETVQQKAARLLPLLTWHEVPGRPDLRRVITPTSPREGYVVGSKGCECPAGRDGRHCYHVECLRLKREQEAKANA